jgi:hypothetical protein
MTSSLPAARRVRTRTTGSTPLPHCSSGYSEVGVRTGQSAFAATMSPLSGSSRKATKLRLRHRPGARAVEKSRVAGRFEDAAFSIAFAIRAARKRKMWMSKPGARDAKALYAGLVE